MDDNSDRSNVQSPVGDRLREEEFAVNKNLNGFEPNIQTVGSMDSQYSVSRPQDGTSYQFYPSFPSTSNNSTTHSAMEFMRPYQTPMGSYTPHRGTPVPVFATQPNVGSAPFLDRLNSCVAGGVFNLFRAGKLLHEGYMNRIPTLIEDCNKFVQKHSKSVTSYILPPLDCYVDSNVSLIITQGQLLYGLLTKPTIPNSVYNSDSDREFKKLRGPLYRIRHMKCFYPSDPPFSGSEISVTPIPFDNRHTDKAHITLKSYLFQIVGASYSVPQDIQSELWSLPFDNELSTRTPFPVKLYTDLRTLFLYFFGIEEDELECGQWEDSFSRMRCLQPWDSLANKKRKYQALSLARSMYMGKGGFHKCLKEALKEIRTAVYSPSLGSKESGSWSYRDRNSKRKIRAPVSCGDNQDENISTPTTSSTFRHNPSNLNDSRNFID
ncbi:hypothetical protein CRE_07999 [Caenorhabditis remanei]|uniref:Uncharacterized protein n=1 Tax=Caenorhabditis remanei TaxID=31234 RepID=E3M3Q1_CAERE|nr:hypothetical protein CRE_07999 [Caenorhabditis remanei]